MEHHLIHQKNKEYLWSLKRVGKIIFNFSGLKYLNSKSIGYIADVFSNVEDNDGQMYISNCDEVVKDVLELVGITTIVPTVESEAEAVSAMA